MGIFVFHMNLSSSAVDNLMPLNCTHKIGINILMCLYLWLILLRLYTGYYRAAQNLFDAMLLWSQYWQVIKVSIFLRSDIKKRKEFLSVCVITEKSVRLTHDHETFFVEILYPVWVSIYHALVVVYICKELSLRSCCSLFSSLCLS